MKKYVEIENHIGGIPTIVEGVIHPAEGDNWNEPVWPAHVERIRVMNMRGQECDWRLGRMTESDRKRIERDLLNEYR